MLRLILMFLFINSVFLYKLNDKPYYDLDLAEKQFEMFIQTYNRNYSPEEKVKRLSIFKENLEKINQKNIKTEHAVFDINKFTDMKYEEYNGHIDYNRTVVQNSSCVPFDLDNLKDAPDSFDWRDQNIVTPPKNQHQCGSCWAQAATGSVESQFAMKYHKQLDLSVQQMIDCNTDHSGCAGGTVVSGLRTVIDEGGQMSAADYPYEESDHLPCRFDASKVQVKITDCYDSPLTDDEIIKKVLYNFGPLAVSMDSRTLGHYKKGIIDDCEVNGQLTHAVLLVGYGTDSNVPYWLMKNSYGPDFGEKGFIRILQGPKDCSMTTSNFTIAVVEEVQM